MDLRVIIMWSAFDMVAIKYLRRNPMMEHNFARNLILHFRMRISNYFDSFFHLIQSLNFLIFYLMSELLEQTINQQDFK
jgi:hypothetical protein